VGNRRHVRRLLPAHRVGLNRGRARASTRTKALHAPPEKRAAHIKKGPAHSGLLLRTGPTPSEDPQWRRPPTGCGPADGQGDDERLSSRESCFNASNSCYFGPAHQGLPPAFRLLCSLCSYLRRCGRLLRPPSGARRGRARQATPPRLGASPRPR
jgi:hypothetical protein